MTTSPHRQPNDDTHTPAEAVARLTDTVRRLGAGADGPELLLALSMLRELRDRLAGWEPALVGEARRLGVTWAEIAPAVGVASRQAAERRYLRLNPRGDGDPTTAEQRVAATRHQRSADRAVAGWARANAAPLRQLAGQITALADRDDLDPQVRASIMPIHAVLGADDAAQLLEPLEQAEPHLRGDYPRLADQISELGRTTTRIREDDRDRRNP
jgi:hypothetical protein